MKESVDLTFFETLIHSHAVAHNAMTCESIADVGLAGFRRVTLRGSPRVGIWVGDPPPPGPSLDSDRIEIMVPEGVAARMTIGERYPLALVVAPDVVMAEGAALREKFRDDR